MRNIQRKMTASLSFKPKKNNILFLIRKIFKNKKNTNNISQTYIPSEEEIKEFEEWCRLQ